VTAISPSGAKSVLGVKVSLDPFAPQDPAVVGLRVGNGELSESGAESSTVICELGDTPVVPFDGAMETTLRAAGAVLVVVVVETGEPPGWWLCPFALGDARRSRLRVTSAPIANPAQRVRATVVARATGERRERALQVVVSAPSLSLLRLSPRSGCRE